MLCHACIKYTLYIYIEYHIYIKCTTYRSDVCRSCYIEHHVFCIEYRMLYIEDHIH